MLNFFLFGFKVCLASEKQPSFLLTSYTGFHLFLFFSTTLLSRKLVICCTGFFISLSLSGPCGMASTLSTLFNCQATSDFQVNKGKSCYFFSLLIWHYWFFTPLEVFSPLILCLLSVFSHVLTLLQGSGIYVFSSPASKILVFSKAF